jgi:hypothetical protein
MFLVTLIAISHGLCAFERKASLADSSIVVRVLSEDNSEWTFRFAHEPGQRNCVPVNQVAEKLGCKPEQIEII